MNESLVSADIFHSFEDLARAYREGVDYRVVRQPRAAAKACIVAPHGGRIEAHTSEIAQAIAGENFSLYLFEGIRKRNNYRALHLTSHRFDEPRCLELLAACDDVVTIHGCSVAEEVVLIGGLDKVLATELQQALTRAKVSCQLTGHRFPATNPKNICNRGRQSAGVQLELSLKLRVSPRRDDLVVAVRDVLLKRSA